MQFKQVLRESCFSLHLEGNTKEAIIGEMIDLLVAAGKLNGRDAALKAVMDRERKMSTGMQHGVAIPHGKTDTVERLVTAFGVKKEGIDFGAMDGLPSTIFVMTISSTLRTGPHLQYLAEISRMLSCPEVREKILASQSVEETMRILTEE